MKKYLIILTLSFCFIASAMEVEKPQLSKNQVEALEEICKPEKYTYCILRAQSYLSSKSPEYCYTQTDEFVEGVLDALSDKFKTDKSSISECLNHRLVYEWRKRNNVK